MPRLGLVLPTVFLAAITALLAPPAAAENADEGLELFEKKIRPVLVAHCYECHSAAAHEPQGGLRLDWRQGIRSGGESGPAVVPGNVDDSLIVSALRHESFEMPPTEKLPEPVVADFVRWIQLGAPDPRTQKPQPDEVARLSWEARYAERAKWWSFQPLAKADVPPVHNSRWSTDPIDRFILSKLEAAGLKPTARADKTALVRRLSFTLTGLPPTPDEVQQFLADTSPAAWQHCVERMLESPHFGEHWARHWMDVVRYTDTYGYEWDIPAKGAWRYRDYLIRAINADVPWNQLMREQIAGDLLEQPRINAAEQINESLAGLMFYQMGEKRHGDSAQFNGIHQEMLDNKIDAFSKAFQALTVSCARCHDHKLGPIAQREYYALAGIFMSSRWVTNTLDLPERNAQQIAKLKQIKRELRSELSEAWQLELPESLDGLFAGVGLANLFARFGFKPDEKEEPRLEEKLSDPSYALLEVLRDKPIATRWKTLATMYADEHKKRRQANQAFEVAADFTQGVPADWSVDGVGLQVVKCGDFTVALEGKTAVGRLLAGGLSTDSLSSRLNGALRTPMVDTFPQKYLFLEHCGGDFAAHRTVVDNAFLTERQTYLKSPELSWLRLAITPEFQGRHVYFELATKTSNPNFPPRVGLGGACSDKQAADPKSWFGVTRVLLSDKPAAPQDELVRFQSLFAGEPPQDVEAVAQRFSNWLRRAVQAWGRDEATAEDVRLINWMLKHELLGNEFSAKGEHPEIAELVNRYRQIEQQLQLPQTVNGMSDIDPGDDYCLNIRGDYDQLGAPVPRSYLQVVRDRLEIESSSSEPQPINRLQLAEMVVDPRNPLTARVFVNRVWHWLFGTGLVATTNDFGQLGEKPSHGQLLDYLAARFMNEGWSLKRLVREIVLTETWQQSSTASPEALAADPTNRLLHHFPLRRLEAESIRDAMLAVSGRLDRQLYGPPIDPHRSNEDPQKRLYSGPLDGLGRRSLYTKITIMEPPRFLATFNQPNPKIPTGRRDVSNTPAQSLTLLNDPFVVGQAKHWAEQLVAGGETSPSQRITGMFETALGRSPSSAETARWVTAAEDFAAARQVPAEKLLGDVGVWQDLAHAMFNTKEFIYLK